MSRCLICNEVIEETFCGLLHECVKVCYLCFNKFGFRNVNFIIDGVKGKILYEYDDFFKELLYRYKKQGDYALKDAFLTFNLSLIKRWYKGFKIIIAPSSEAKELERGFCHLEEIFKSLKLPIIKCFRKEIDWKQSDKKRVERLQIQNIIKIDKTMLNGVKKVLLVDDVLTTGSTIRAMISQIPPNIFKKVLVLSSNCRILGNEIV